MDLVRKLHHGLRVWAALVLSASLLRFILRLWAWGLLLLAFYVFADAQWALPTRTRQVWNLLAPALLLGCALAGLRGPGRSRDLALRLDRARQDRRRTVGCALDLAGQPATSPLYASMRQAALREGIQALAQSPLRAMLPFRSLLVLASLAMAGSAAAWTFARARPELTRTVLARILRPDADIAPWTRLRFTVQPEELSVIYGEDLRVTVRIEGGPIQGSVSLRTRVGGTVHESACFRESADSYSQRLEQVTEAMEICFAVGRIRGPWQRVAVQTLPRVESARVTLTPPAYSGLPTRRFAFGEQGLDGLPGSGIELVLTSNRPLAGGDLWIETAGGSQPERHRGTVTGQVHTVFRWTLREPAALRVDLRDLQGQGMAQALRGQQRLLEDKAPSVVLTDPPRFALATPGIRVPLRGYAEDDHGVSRLTLVRGMPGFIDRATVVAEGPAQRRRAFAADLDLHRLGVEPGQTLELYLEATDNQPGHGASGVSELTRIQIITREEYALGLRNREKLEGFRQRFALAAAAMDRVAAATGLLQDLIRQGASTAEQADALRALLQAQHQASLFFAEMERDFPIFELESASQSRLGELAKHFEQNVRGLEKLHPEQADFAERIAEIAGAFATRAADYKKQQEPSDEFLRMGALLEQTVAWRRLVQRQERLVRELGRHAYSLSPDERTRFRRLEETQRAILADLDAWMEETGQRAAALPANRGEWAMGARQMIQDLKDSALRDNLRGAAESVANEANRQAFQRAGAALEAMKAIPEDQRDSPFQQACRGGGMPQGGGDPLAASLDQLLRALNNADRSGGENPGGSGGGPGGFSDDGYAVGGSSLLNIPMLGPNRHRFDMPRGGFVEGGAASGGRPGQRQADLRLGEGVAGSDAPAHLPAVEWENTPTRYRDAVRAYFEQAPETSR